MSLDIVTILDAIQSHALTTGRFDSVNGAEPKSPPTSPGITAAVWVQKIGPAVGGSGLSSTSTRLAFSVRLYTPMVQEPASMIDPNLMAALDDLMALYSGDFTLGGLVRQVDLLGQFGDPLGADAGYVIEGGVEFRVMTIVLPVIVNDLWEQVA
jgi:hypothetical protein